MHKAKVKKLSPEERLKALEATVKHQQKLIEGLMLGVYQGKERSQLVAAFINGLVNLNLEYFGIVNSNIKKLSDKERKFLIKHQETVFFMDKEFECIK